MPQLEDRARRARRGPLVGSASSVALRLTLGYASGALIWIVVSDQIVGRLNLPEPIDTVVNSTKGLAFVIVTSAILYWLTRMLVSRAESEERAREVRIRQAYEDVLDAATGGKLELLTDRELDAALGDPITEEIPLLDAAHLADIRAHIRDAVAVRFGKEIDLSAILTSSGEAMTNALKYAEHGSVRAYVLGDTVQIAVTDDGPGIDFRTLPKATLQPGFSTASTLGMGFTMMLQLADCIMLSTRPGRTTVVAEVSVADTRSVQNAR